MNIYRIDKIRGEDVYIADFSNPGVICGEFTNRKEGFYHEGDVVYYSKKDKEYLFVKNADAQLGWLIIKSLTNNGVRKYDELSAKEQKDYDNAVKLIDDCYKNPVFFDKATSYNFAAERAAKFELLKGE